MSSPTIQWYPGHIAKAELHLRKQLQRVDAVLEVLDARIPLTSRHPSVASWIQAKPCVVVLNKMDCIPPDLVKAWTRWFKQQGIRIYPTNGQSGQGVQQLKQAALQLGAHVNERRHQRGMKPRPVRAVVIGFPNVGKSALLNRLLGQRLVNSAAKPGVTRQLQWVRIGGDLDLLDAPGIIPPQLEDQGAATKLAICDDIGEAAYTTELVAGRLIELLIQLKTTDPLVQRYQMTDLDQPSSILLAQLAQDRYQADIERAARHVLTDFRKGLLGSLALETPPEVMALSPTDQAITD